MKLNNNIERPDVFSQKIREKLEDHQLVPENEIWEQIEGRLQKEKRRTIFPFWLRISSVGIAASFVLAFLFLFKFENNVEKVSVEQNFTTDKILFGSIVLKEKVEIFEKVKRPVSNFDNRTTQPATNSNNEKNDFIQTSTSKTKDTENQNFSKKEDVEEKKNKPLEKGQKKRTSLDNEPNDDWISKNKKKTIAKDNWTLALNMARGNNSNSQINLDNKWNFPTAWNEGLDKTAESERFGTKYDTKNFLPPLSFGLTLRKNLNSWLNVESGVVYTFLQTNMSNSAISTSSASLKLHYLGVPLNLSADIWENSKWNIYYSAGGMVEKGLKSTLSESVNESTHSESIDGLQWSAQTSIGVAYNFLPNFGLYIEPKLSYYFDNNQPQSIRTEKPLTLGLNVGLQYRIK